MNIKRIDIERQEKWREWAGKIPELQLKEGWKIKVIPSFGGALVRFLISVDDASVSVYLDVNDSLGCVGQPYWEIHPLKDDVARFLMYETDDLINGIDESLKHQLANPSDN